MEKRKIKITLEVLNEVAVEFSKTKEFIEERLKQRFVKENISVDEVIFLFTSKELAEKNIFYFIVLGLKAETL